MKVAIYARVGTANNAKTPPCRRGNFTSTPSVVAGRREYLDIGISDTKETRPGLDRLMADAHRRNPLLQ
jgi:hypothetical protein